MPRIIRNKEPKLPDLYTQGYNDGYRVGIAAAKADEIYGNAGDFYALSSQYLGRLQSSMDVHNAIDVYISTEHDGTRHYVIVEWGVAGNNRNVAAQVTGTYIADKKIDRSGG